MAQNSVSEEDLMAASIVSMLVSVSAYGIVHGVYVGIGFVAMILIHEGGHSLAAWHRNVPSSPPFFIPFLGAVILVSPDHMKDRDTEAYIGFGGPLLGSVGAMACYLVYFLMPPGSEEARALFVTSMIGVWLNLFNLIPMKPLDGGRVSQAVAPWLHYSGLALLVLLTIAAPQFGFLLFWALLLLLLGPSHLLNPEQDDKRPPLDLAVRAQWMTFHAFLAVFLLCVFVSQVVVAHKNPALISLFTRP